MRLTSVWKVNFSACTHRQKTKKKGGTSDVVDVLLLGLHALLVLGQRGDALAVGGLEAEQLGETRSVAGILHHAQFDAAMSQLGLDKQRKSKNSRL